MGEKIVLHFKIMIFKYKSTLPYFPMFSDKINGPYVSLEILEEVSPIMQQLKMKYSKKEYEILFEERNISEMEDWFLFPKNKSYPKDLVHMVTHGSHGDFKRNAAKGGHFLDAKKVRIIKQIAIDSKGVIRAEIELFNHKQDKWMPKKGISTLFPQTWSIQKYVNECRYCLENKHHINGDVYKATTKCGIETTLIIVKGKIITFYPKFTE